MNSIFTRRSIRTYTEKTVECEKIEKILAAGMAAPSAGDQQEWEFVVVTDNEIKGRLAVSSPNAITAKKAPVVIVPVYNMDRIDHPKYYQQDMAACCQNMLLEANELGLGAVWMGMAPDEIRMATVSKILRLPENIKPFCIMAIGYTDEKPAVRYRYDVNRVRWNGWIS